MAPARPSRKAKETGAAKSVAAQPKPRTPRKKKPAAELIGARISINYPGETKKFEARVLDYDARTKLHKLFYFEDDSIEELSMSSKRKWNVLEETVPSPDPQGAAALLGKIVLLPVNASKELNPAEPVSDFRAMVVEMLDEGTEEDEEDEEEHSVTPATAGAASAPATGEGAAALATGEGAASPATGIDPSAPVIEEAAAAPVIGEAAAAPVIGEAAAAPVIGEANAAPVIGEADAAPVTGEAAAAPVQPAATPANPTGADTGTSPDPIWHRVVYLANDCLATVNLNEVRYTILDNVSGAVVRVVNADKGEVELDKPEEPTPIEATPTSSSPVVPVGGGAETAAKDDAVNPVSASAAVGSAVESPTAAPVASAAQASGAGSSLNKATAAVVTEGNASPEEGSSMPIAPAQVTPSRGSTLQSIGQRFKGLFGFEKSPSAQTTPAHPVAPVQAAVSPNAEVNTASPATQANQPGSTIDVVGSVAGSEIKPLTQSNLDAHDVTMSAAAGQSGRKTAEMNGQDEEIMTVSDAEEVQQGNRLSTRNEKNLVNQFVKISQGGMERVAHVEAYLEAKNCHLVVFYDEAGGNLQVRLTKDNHTVLSREESSKITTEGRPKRSLKRKIETEDTGKASKRGRPANAVGTKKGPGKELIGECISIQWPGTGGTYYALVVGYQDRGPGERKHKVYYIADESIEVLDLSQRSWSNYDPNSAEGTDSVPWDRKGLVGKRLYVLWEAEYDDEYPEDRRISETFFGAGKTKVPYEAFVVQFISSFRYKLLYTQDDNVEDRMLTMEDENWDVLEAGSMKANGMSLISWSSE